MPRRNAIRQYATDNHYHCYNRGVGKMDIFRDADDFGYFLSLFARHLSIEPKQDKTRRQYPHYVEDVELEAYCLMPNHYHLILYLKETHGIERLMRSVMTAYSRYFNLRYDRVGAVFESEFLAVRAKSDAYLWHLSRYVHMNPIDIGIDPLTYDYSSIGYFRGNKTAEWLRPERLVSTQEERDEYVASLNDAADYRKLRNQLKLDRSE